jgi:hypothetical protein
MRDTSSPWLYPDSHEAAKDDVLLAHRLHETIDYIDEIVTPLDHTSMALPDADLIKHEFATAAQMLRHGAKRALSQLESAEDKPALLADLAAIEAEYRRNWLARNRPGGLEDSVARLRSAGELYAK